MTAVDDLINLIDARDERRALDFVEHHPDLAAGQSVREGQLRGATPLHWAAHRNHVRLCQRLLELGADVNSSSSSYWWRTPLAWAADAGSADAVELLLTAGANVNQDVYGNMIALHAVAQGGSTNPPGNPEAYRRTAELLIRHGADIHRRADGDRGQTPLEDAVRAGNEAVERLLTGHGVTELP
jgi:ankyrin repeat protein